MKNFARESFALTFVGLGFMLIIITFIAEFSSNFAYDPQTFFLMAITCFGTYAYLMSAFYDKEVREEIIKLHIILVYGFMLFAFSVLLSNNIIYSITNIDFMGLFEFLRPLLDSIFLAGSELNEVRYLLYSLLFFYFFFNALVMLLLFLFGSSRFWKEVIVEKHDTVGGEEEE